MLSDRSALVRSAWTKLQPCNETPVNRVCERRAFVKLTLFRCTRNKSYRGGPNLHRVRFAWLKSWPSLNIAPTKSHPVKSLSCKSTSPRFSLSKRCGPSSLLVSKPPDRKIPLRAAARILGGKLVSTIFSGIALLTVAGPVPKQMKDDYQ